MREVKADSTADPTEPSNPDAGNSATTDSLAEDKSHAQPKPKRSRTMGLAASSPNHSSSHSRRSTVTDKGQTGPAADYQSEGAPPMPAVPIPAPDRKASPLPSFTRELGGPMVSPLGIVVSDNPQSPDTLIPATDTLSTRPTKGGIAYPFSLKVDGPAGKDVNASTLTLQSMNITTPPAVDVPEREKELGTVGSSGETVNDQILNERLGEERYFTAAPGAGLFSSAVRDDVHTGSENVKRPHVERFETAREDLSMLAKGDGRV